MRLLWMPFIAVVSLLGGCQKEVVFQQTWLPEKIITAGDPLLTQREIRLWPDTVYVLATDMLLTNGQKLVVEPGTIIKVRNNLGITIGPGAVIEAVGKADKPIVFTTVNPPGQRGVASTSIALSSQDGWRGITIEGLKTSAQAAPSSGRIEYVRIEFAGLSDAALRLQNVDAGTSLSHIQVSYASNYQNSSFLFSGGDAEAKHLVAYASAGNDFELANGYQGNLQFLLAYRHPAFPAIFGNLKPRLVRTSGLWISGSQTKTAVSNLTVLGPGIRSGLSTVYVDTPTINTTLGVIDRQVSLSAALLLQDGSRYGVFNSVFTGFPRYALYVQDRATAINLQRRESLIKNSIFFSEDAARTLTLERGAYPPFTSADLKQFLLTPEFGNTVATSQALFAFVDPYNYDNNPQPVPGSGSILLTGADFINLPAGVNFKTVSFRGALGTENWMQGWVNFTPLRTDYNPIQ